MQLEVERSAAAVAQAEETLAPRLSALRTALDEGEAAHALALAELETVLTTQQADLERELQAPRAELQKWRCLTKALVDAQGELAMGSGVDSGG